MNGCLEGSYEISNTGPVFSHGLIPSPMSAELELGSYDPFQIGISLESMGIVLLVGGLVAIFYFPIYWE